MSLSASAWEATELFYWIDIYKFQGSTLTRARRLNYFRHADQRCKSRLCPITISLHSTRAHLAMVRQAPMTEEALGGRSFSASRIRTWRARRRKCLGCSSGGPWPAKRILREALPVLLCVSAPKAEAPMAEGSPSYRASLAPPSQVEARLKARTKRIARSRAPVEA